MLFLIACTHENPPEVQNAAILSDVAMVRVFDNTMSQSDLIRNAAEQFDLKQAVTRSEKEEREIREIVPINGDNGEPSMYVVNYADNKGWVIVSASTDYAPILAHSDEGNFEVSNIEGNAIEVWVDETKAAIESMKTAPDKEDGSFLDYNSTYNYNRQDIINIYPINN
ncbi:MAG: Spi family protease inhibitor [Phocaeicola sp.]|nr:Spi family protease inhibitor [Phocaeicola sp.]